MEDNQPTNKLALYRKRMKFSQKQVAAILGLENVSALSNYERGVSLPTLERALTLGIVYRVPLEFLFPGLYHKLREELREREARLFGYSEEPGALASN